LDKGVPAIQGIIIRGVGGLYGVRLTHQDEPAAEGEILCRARGIFRLEGITPLVGDSVEVVRDSEPSADPVLPELPEKTEPDGEADAGVRVDYVIDRILPRKSALIRPPVANLTHLFAVIPAAQPKPDLLTADKLTVIAENYGIEPVIVINKADLDPGNTAELTRIYESAGYRVFALSAATGDGVDALYRFIEETAAGDTPMLSAFAGVSGAGKSTLMTGMFPELKLKTGGVSRKTERGRHTTRHVELYPVKIGGGILYIADTPGFSMLDFTRFNFFPTDELALSFREFAECVGTCRYTKCTHTKEEGCAVIRKLDAGQVSPSRHDSYIKILEEMKKKPDWERQKEEEKNLRRSSQAQTPGRQGRKHGKR